LVMSAACAGVSAVAVSSAPARAPARDFMFICLSFLHRRDAAANPWARRPVKG
jgi:hypothetical protein